MAKPKQTIRKRRLKDLNDCVRAGAWLWNEISTDAMENQKAGKLTYLLNVQKGICQAIEEQKLLGDLAERMEQIEKQLNVQN